MTHSATGKRLVISVLSSSLQSENPVRKTWFPCNAPKLHVTLPELLNISTVDVAAMPCERLLPQVRSDVGATAVLDAPFPNVEVDRPEVCLATPSMCKLRCPSLMCPQYARWPSMDVVMPCPSPNSQQALPRCPSLDIQMDPLIANLSNRSL